MTKSIFAPLLPPLSRPVAAMDGSSSKSSMESEGGNHRGTPKNSDLSNI
eukprot:CAMPEP_0197253308 /NCGR_PEP_ID=MMETSP1429-20130617/64543_1 /TAXON_ID=49237 /ORGANISM="Chaetoceros  sp., Strain UNC1202" /LENGTH=48 /DNA_ID= /DNA_START= /DNA_END= /DNA_ORIENTATION=